MWYAALILSALALSMYFGTRRPGGAWMASPRTTRSEKPYLWEHQLGKKYRPLASRIGIAARLPFVFRVEEERFSHRISKWFGFCEEFQTEHAEFDRRAYIISDDKQFQRRLRDNTGLHRQICSAFAQGAQKIYYIPGYLIIRLKNAVPNPPPEAETLVDALTAMRDALASGDAAASRPDTRRRLARGIFRSLPVFFLLAAFITLLLSTILGFRITQWQEFVPYSLELAACIVAAALIAMRALFGRSSYGHEVLMHFLQWGSWSALLLSGTMIWFVNCEYDRSPPQEHGGTVLEKHIGSARKSKTYFVRLQDWHRPEDTISVQVTFKLYKRLKLSDAVVITSRAGLFGMEWIEKVEKQE